MVVNLNIKAKISLNYCREIKTAKKKTQSQLK